MDEGKMGDGIHVPGHLQLTRDSKLAKNVEIRPSEIVSRMVAANRGIPVASAYSWHLPSHMSLAIQD